MLTVVCVLKSGGIYNADWVARLRAGVKKHLPVIHRFVCLSDVDVPCQSIPLAHNWPGWWSKIEVLKLDGPVLFFDLDTLIVGDLTDLASVAMRAPFAMLRDFYRPDGLGSGVMSWNDRDLSAHTFHDSFLFSPQTWMNDCPGGDQQFIERVCHRPGVRRFQDLLPGQIVSYKADRCARGVPYGARVVCLHGRPKFSDMPATDEVRIAWEQAA